MMQSSFKKKKNVMEFILQKEEYFGYKIGGNSFFNGGKMEFFKLGLCIAPILISGDGNVDFQTRWEIRVIFDIFRGEQCNLFLKI